MRMKLSAAAKLQNRSKLHSHDIIHALLADPSGKLSPSPTVHALASSCSRRTAGSCGSGGWRRWRDGTAGGADLQSAECKKQPGDGYHHLIKDKSEHHVLCA